MVMNKKGYIKTLEAVIAIVMILIFTFAVTPKPVPSYSLPSAVENAQTFILEEIERDDILRGYIMDAVPGTPSDALTNAETGIKTLVDANMPAGYDYAVGLCQESACAANLTPIAMERSVYTAEAMIGSGGTQTIPRVVRIWMWRK